MQDSAKFLKIIGSLQVRNPREFGIIMRWLLSFGILTLALSASAANAQAISGEIGLHSRYFDDDLLMSTAEPVIQAAVNIDVSEGCSIDAWASHGVATRTGSEIDLGVSCRIAIANEAEIEISTARDIVHESDDLTEITAGITIGQANVTFAQYFWDGNPDASRIAASYSMAVNPSLQFTPMALYETGFGEADIFVGGAMATYAFNKNLMFDATVLTPVIREQNELRTTQAKIGLRFVF